MATNSSGVATFSNLIITGTVGSYTLTFTPTALTPTTSSSFTLTVGAAAQIAVNAGNGQAAAPARPSPRRRASSSDRPRRQPRGRRERHLRRDRRRWHRYRLPGHHQLRRHRRRRQLGTGTTAGANTLSATSAGLTGSPVTFNATSIVVGTPYGGGVVGYILQSGDPGYVAGQTHGLIAATSDQSSAIIWALSGFQSTSVGATSTALGTGSTNTAKIVAQNGPGTAYAAGLARPTRRRLQ